MTKKKYEELFFSIIIPVKYINDYLLESIENCLKLNYSNYEILVFPDKSFHYENSKVRIIETGNIGPAEKRDLSIKHAKGSVLAFLDDDAYPDSNWLNNAIRYFNNNHIKKNICAACGPAVTPSNDNIIQKLSGEIYSSFIASGNTTYRYSPAKKTFEVDDYPSVNFIIKKYDFESVGGFDSTFWPGEDTKLCLDLINIDKKIIYDPKILVYHHRRKSFKKHLVQVFNYGYHRGYFVKKYPKNSAKFSYFIPALFLLFTVFGFVFSFFNIYISYIYITIMAIYVLLLIINSIVRLTKNKSFIISLLLISGIFFIYFFYGSGFIKGLLSRKVYR